MARKRVNISVSGELLRRMERERRRHGFKNLCRLTVASVRAVLDATERRRRAEADDGGAADDETYIENMFGEYAEQERERDGHRRKTGRRHGD
ncbi:MAG: hypothetical protein LUD72_01045 [Bacteroidales bacterium]|nr:hypothetical protein [Bacteroidales bacterium]